ncbi:BTAD domain-containing putative transcriptional regulator [Actinoplanes aureus]|uniref:AfsR family transcriptional regulator n=1 Tax=Actinoplanes aureus TaxID=2792083 RepID=A0A931FZV4_9ACTN|nr:BTAD domain-containing putative transcriptional regulator [Actinoplanes aureus]MBG0566068.1 AfsR family transcriptional regulator [Actinoplanes aureus]
MTPAGIELSVGVLGTLVVRAGGQEQVLGGPSGRIVVQRLIVAGGDVVAVDTLIDDVWAGAAPPTAVATLHGYVSRLRRVLEPGRRPRDAAQVLVRLGSGYALRLPDGVLDSERFARLAQQGSDRLAGGDPEGALEVLDRALALWRGPAYADCADRAFAQPEVNRLTELRVSATENQLAAMAELGRHDAAAAALEAYTKAHPLRERGWELLALTLYRQGRQGDALAALRTARQHLSEELGVDPGPGIVALQAAILGQDPALLPAARPTAAGPRGNLPARRSSLVGRTDELRTVDRLLRRHRLVTLLGPGGMGKTRLAVELARSRDDSDGPWLVELAGLHDAALLAETVAKAVGVTAGDVATLAGVLRERRTLVVLDNCEHLVEHVAPFVEELLGACPDLRVLATSREALDAEGEHAYEVPPLAADDAVRLFVERAGAVVPDFSPEAGERPVLDRLCADLDGMPLPIELAAGQCKVLSLGEMVGLIDDRFTLLRGGRRANTRHATMRSAVEWSYDLLTADEREVFQALAIFEGGFQLDAAGQVSGRADIVVQLSSLVAKSMVTVVGGDPRRYRMLETLRQYAAERTEPARRARLIERHVAWVRSLSEATAGALLGAEWTGRLNDESANIRAALDNAGDPAAVLHIATGFYWFWYREGHVAEGLRYLEPGLAYWAGEDRPDAPDHGVRARAALGLALLYYLAGSLDRVGESLQRAGEHAALSGSGVVQGQVLATVSYFEARSAQVPAAREHAGQALLLARAFGRIDLEAEVLMVLGEVERQDGHLDEAADRLREAQARAEACGYAWVTVSSQWIHAKVEIARCRWEPAQDLLLRSVEGCYAGSDTTSWLVGIATLSHVLHERGRTPDAAELAGIVQWQGSRVGFSPYAMDPELAAYRERLHAALTPVELAAAGELAYGMSRAEVMDRVRKLAAG